MRINAGLTNALAATSQAAAQPPDPQGRRRRVNSDVAQISDEANLLSNAQAKLAQLQAAHAAGTYQVSPSQIARSIINAHLKV
jgi:anti-sigma28 factor (negative regulator of flagellin synthesis)